MAYHHFDTAIAEQYGINAAVILQNIIFWTEKKVANGQSADDGLFYIYNSIPAWQALFPYLSEKQVRGALGRLEECGIITSRNDLNKAGYDRTKHYAITAKHLNLFILPKGQMDTAKRADGYCQKGRTIPDSKPDNNPDNNHTPIPPEGAATKAQKARSIMDIYNEVNEQHGKPISGCSTINPSRQRQLDKACKLNMSNKTPFADYNPKAWRRYFELAFQNPWNLGQNPSGWKATFDYLIKDTNILKVLEAHYA